MTDDQAWTRWWRKRHQRRREEESAAFWERQNAIWAAHFAEKNAAKLEMDWLEWIYQENIAREIEAGELKWDWVIERRGDGEMPVRRLVPNFS